MRLERGLKMDADLTEGGLEKIRISGAKRANIVHSDWLDDWWVGHGKDESCQFEGSWADMANFASKILSHPNTEKVAPDLYRPALKPTNRF